MKFMVDNVFIGKYGTKFNLHLAMYGKGAVVIYGCRVVEGREGDFIGWPSYKDKKGKYWNHVYAELSEEATEEILTEVRAQAKAQDDSSKGRKRRE